MRQPFSRGPVQDPNYTINTQTAQCQTTTLSQTTVLASTRGHLPLEFDNLPLEFDANSRKKSVPLTAATHDLHYYPHVPHLRHLHFVRTQSLLGARHWYHHLPFFVLSPQALCLLSLHFLTYLLRQPTRKHTSSSFWISCNICTADARYCCLFSLRPPVP